MITSICTDIHAGTLHRINFVGETFVSIVMSTNILTSDSQNEMKRTIANYVFLSFVVAGSFLAICTYDFYPDEPYDRSLDSFRLLTPGVLFSVFIIVVQKSNWAIGKMVLFFFILLTLYSVCLIASLSSWGLAVPFFGGIGAWVIRKLFYQSATLLDAKGKEYFVLGFIAGLVGLFFFFARPYAFQDLWTSGMGFGFILGIWQIVFGILWLKENAIIPKQPISAGHH